MIDLATFEFPATAQWSEAVEKHMAVCREYFSVIRPSRAYRAETKAEAEKRYYWSKKSGRKITKLEFWMVAPNLTSNAVIVSSVEEAEAKFGAGARAPKARLYKAKERARKVRKLDYVALKPRDFVRVRIIANGQQGVITAYGSRGFRVTIDPKVKWKNKFRRWLSKKDLAILDGKEFPK